MAVVKKKTLRDSDPEPWYMSHRSAHKVKIAAVETVRPKKFERVPARSPRGFDAERARRRRGARSLGGAAMRRIVRGSASPDGAFRGGAAATPPLRTALGAGLGQQRAR